MVSLGIVRILTPQECSPQYQMPLNYHEFAKVPRHALKIKPPRIDRILASVRTGIEITTPEHWNTDFPASAVLAPSTPQPWCPIYVASAVRRREWGALPAAPHASIRCRACHPQHRIFCTEGSLAGDGLEATRKIADPVAACDGDSWREFRFYINNIDFYRVVWIVGQDAWTLSMLMIKLSDLLWGCLKHIWKTWSWGHDAMMPCGCPQARWLSHQDWSAPVWMETNRKMSMVPESCSGIDPVLWSMKVRST